MKDWSQPEASILDISPSLYNKYDVVKLPGRAEAFNWFAVTDLGFYLFKEGSSECLKNKGSSFEFSKDACTLFQLYRHPRTFKLADAPVPPPARIHKVLPSSNGCNYNNSPFNIGQLQRGDTIKFDEPTNVRSTPVKDNRNPNYNLIDIITSKTAEFPFLGSYCHRNENGSFTLWYNIQFTPSQKAWAFWAQSEPTAQSCIPTELNDAYCSDDNKVLYCRQDKSPEPSASGHYVAVLDDCNTHGDESQCMYGTVNGHFARYHCE